MALSTVLRDMTKVKIYTNNLTLIIKQMTLDQNTGNKNCEELSAYAFINSAPYFYFLDTSKFKH